MSASTLATLDAPVSLQLSVVMPYFKRLQHLRRVFPYNAAFLSRTDAEVVLVLDEPTEEAEVLRFVREYPAIRWRVVVNDHDHAWRAPSSPLNVGVRQSLGDHILVVSPESAFDGDVPANVLEVMHAHPGCAVIGQVAFATYDRVQRLGGIATAFSEAKSPEPKFFGSICAPRSVFRLVRGYDESIAKWGGDDNNLRHRIMMLGVTLFADEDVRVLHLSDTPRGTVNPAFAPPSAAELPRILNPTTPFANPSGWGREFSRVALDWTQGP